jgi:beta-glucanase (GH16 family)
MPPPQIAAHPDGHFFSAATVISCLMMSIVMCGQSAAGQARDQPGTDAAVSSRKAHAGIGEITAMPAYARSPQHSPYVPEGYGCIWHDEFDGVDCNEHGCELNGAYWQFQNLNVNNEQMLYTQRQCTEYPEDYNYCIRDGVFSIQARDEGQPVRCEDVHCAKDYGWQCEFGTGCADRAARYTSGRAMTKNRFAEKYGYIEVAFRLPFSRQGASRSGLWPAFWMLDATIAEGPSSCGGEPLDRSCENPWPTAGEVDVLEHVSATPDRIFHNVHWDPGADGPRGDHTSCDDIPKDACSENLGWRTDLGTGFPIDWRQWNVIGLQWRENAITWILNGKINGTLDTTGEQELNRAMYPIMNLAVGGNMGGEVDIHDWTDAFLEFAYIRWYQRDAKDSCDLSGR